MARAEATTTMITGYFRRRSKARAAVDSLRDAGFSHRQVSLALRPDDDLEPVVPPGAAAQVLAEKTTSMWTRVAEYFNHGRREPDSSYDEFLGSLSGFSLPESYARYFGHQFMQGDEGAIVSVVAPGRE